MKTLVALLGALVVMAPGAVPCLGGPQPEVLDRWHPEVPFDYRDINSIEIGPDGSIYLLLDTGVAKYSPQGSLLGSFGPGYGLVGFDIAPNGDIVATNANWNEVVRFSNQGTVLARWGREGPEQGRVNIPMGVAIGQDGTIFVADNGGHRIVHYGPDGDFLGSMDLGSENRPVDVLLDDAGNFYISFNDGPYVQKLSPSGVPIRHFTIMAGNVEVGRPYGLAFDPRGNLFVADGFFDAGIGVFSPGGRPLGRIAQQSEGKAFVYIRGVAIDAQDGIWVVDHPAEVTHLARFGPAVPPVREPAVMMHVTDPVQSGACGAITQNPREIITHVNDTGDRYVYLLGSPELWVDGQAGGLTGFQWGLNISNPDDLVVHSWNRCGMLDFPMPRWPESGTGNTITWAVGACQEKEIVTAGWFFVTAYAPATMSIVGYPTTGQVKVADCLGAEAEPAVVVPPSRLGWIAIGDASRNGKAGGCNPLLENCEATTPVQRTTWGRIKDKY